MEKVTVIINAWNEPKTIGRAIECVAKRAYSGAPENLEVIQVSPDDLTLEEGLKKAKELGIEPHFKQIKDPKKGKPFALNLGIKESTGEIVIMTDGDVFFGPGAVGELLKPLERSDVGGVVGRPYSADSKQTMFEYFGHLLADSAHHRRTALTEYQNDEEFSVTTDKFMMMSGYIYAIRKFDFEIPANALVEDAYISYLIFNKGKKLAYAPKATVYVKYPKSLKEYLAQKTRSLGGYKQLVDFGVVEKGKVSRGFFEELSYAFFPITYAQSFTQFCWSLMLFPVRLLTWFNIKREVKVIASNMGKTDGWKRTDSTK